MLQSYGLAAISLAALWTLCALAPPLVRRALLDGIRCLARYPDIWRIPLIFGLAYEFFQIAAAAIFHWRMEEDLLAWLTSVAWQPAPDVAPLAFSSLLPAAEQTAAVLTFFTATFPLSAIFALLLLFNYRNLFVEMARALRRRLGRGLGAFLIVLFFLIALAAIGKPVIYLFLPEIAERMPVSAALAVNAVSTIFELLLGIFFLTYLMLMAYAWRRGLYFHRAKLLQLAMRRTGFVLKWSLVVAAAEVILVVLPLFLGVFGEPGAGFYEGCMWFSSWIGRPAVTALALFFCPVQTILVFHNESLRQALRESRLLLRARWPSILPFLLVCYGAFLILEAASAAIASQFGADTAAALGSRMIAAGIEAALAGWLIASWVCLYKSFSAGRKEILF